MAAIGKDAGCTYMTKSVMQVIRRGRNFGVILTKGNAKRFKRTPEKSEKALILECSVINPIDNKPIEETCLTCKDYFEMQKYFKTNQECVGKMILIKNNSPISIENGQVRFPTSSPLNPS
jgi:hypothetical protein